MGQGGAMIRTGDLASDNFQQRGADLPKAHPPRWLLTGLLATMATLFALTAVVLLGPMEELVSVQGVVRPSDYYFVFSPKDGILEEIFVRQGEHVEEGTLLARLEGREEQRNLVELEGEIAQAEAELALAHAQVRKTEAAPLPPEFLFSGLDVEKQSEVTSLQQAFLERLQEIEKSGAASQAEVLNLRLQLINNETLLRRSREANQLLEGEYGAATKQEALERQRLIAARLTSLQKALALAREDLKRLDLFAPRAGIVFGVTQKFPGGSVSAGETLFKIANPGTTDLRLYATEDRIHRIRPGQAVRFRPNNNVDRLVPMARGRVVSVAIDRDLEGQPSQSSSLQDLPTYRINVAVEESAVPLVAGASADAEIILEKHPFWKSLFIKNRSQ